MQSDVVVFESKTVRIMEACDTMEFRGVKVALARSRYFHMVQVDGQSIQKLS